MESLPAWCRIVREPSAELADVFRQRPTITTPDDAVAYVQPRLGSEEVEVFAAIYLDTHHRVIDLQEITRGTLDSTLVHPREVFRLAIALSAFGVILAHNHPSGVMTPSREDVILTKDMVTAGEVLGIAVLDHVIVGLDATQFTSLRADGLM
jgi:DNA repair protein RadC